RCSPAPVGRRRRSRDTCAGWGCPVPVPSPPLRGPLPRARHGLCKARKQPARAGPLRPSAGGERMPSFRAAFVAVVMGAALLVAAFMINWYRPRVVTEQPSAALVRASGKCAECHANLHYSVVHEYELSAHARKRINCLECHQPAGAQEGQAHHGFVITTRV